MNTNDLMIFLVAIAALSGTLMFFAHQVIRKFETATPQPVKRMQARSDYPRIARRKRAASYPGIICALPMHQVKRAEAPMNDIWSR